MTLTEGTLTLGTTTANASGSWSFTPTSLAQGTNTIVATETNAAKYVTTSSLTFVYDTSVVTEQLASNSSGGCGNNNGGTVSADTLTGKADPGRVVTLTEGTLTLGTTTANASGSWSFTPTSLAQGTHTIVATETNAANYVSTASLTFVYDTLVPTGLAVTPVTGSGGIGSVSSTSGLSAGTLATLSETGGTVGDAYSDALGSGSSSGLQITSAGKLSVSGSVSGGSSGKLLVANVLITDTTNGLTSAALPVDVVVGGTSAAISLSSLGVSASAPSFVFGVSATTSINATGHTGALWIDGGAGAQTMTGGTGASTYLYDATGDSTRTAFDTIANFHVGTDVLNFAGLNGSLNSLAMSNGATTLAAHTVGWLQSGGNTFVYVNNSGSSETLASNIDMKIQLSGAVSLTSSNFVL